MLIPKVLVMRKKPGEKYRILGKLRIEIFSHYFCHCKMIHQNQNLANFTEHFYNKKAIDSVMYFTITSCESNVSTIYDFMFFRSIYFAIFTDYCVCSFCLVTVLVNMCQLIYRENK